MARMEQITIPAVSSAIGTAQQSPTDSKSQRGSRSFASGRYDQKTDLLTAAHNRLSAPQRCCYQRPRLRNLQNTEYFRSVFGPEKRIGILAVFRLKILEIVLFLLFRSSLRAKKGFMRVLGRIFPKVIEYLGPKLKQV